jgi:aryl-alcohol dehydrogenase-like predicted oxidoreductase
MRTVHLSQTIAVGAIGYGCMGLSGTYGKSNDAAAVALLRQAVELGVNFFDTADSYGPFHNEKLVGEALRPIRDKLIIATKFGQEFLPDGSRCINGRPAYVRAACEASLGRLGIDCIDLYFAHRIDKTVPIEETVGEMSRLVDEGKVRAIGVSEATPQTIRRAHAVHKLAAVQSEYSLWSREVEAGVLPTIRELGIGFVAYSPLGRGFLTGAITNASDLAEGDVRRILPRFQGDNLSHNRTIADRIGRIARAKSATPAQVSLAWVLARGDDIAVIPGTRRLSALRENLAAAAITLSIDEIKELDDALPVARGDRYHAPIMAALDG